MENLTYMFHLSLFYFDQVFSIHQQMIRQQIYGVEKYIENILAIFLSAVALYRSAAELDLSWKYTDKYEIWWSNIYKYIYFSVYEVNF